MSIFDFDEEQASPFSFKRLSLISRSAKKPEECWNAKALLWILLLLQRSRETDFSLEKPV